MMQLVFFQVCLIFVGGKPKKGVVNPLKKGLRLLAKGELPSAVLLFEMEVQQRPDSIKGWQYLGSTLGDNGQEAKSFAALDK